LLIGFGMDINKAIDYSRTSSCFQHPWLLPMPCGWPKCVYEPMPGRTPIFFTLLASQGTLAVVSI
jgi:hypothetical protein